MSDATARPHASDWYHRPGPSTADVTVVVCTRDRPDMLANALSALAQALEADVDVVVVDSASRLPDTAEVAQKAGVRYVRTDTPGLSIARNLGLAHSDRQIVVFTDDDCAVTPGFLTPLLAPFSSSSVGATTGRLRDASAAGATHPVPPPSPDDHLSKVTAGLDAGHGALMAFRREPLISSGGFDPILGAGRHFGGAEDMDVFCRILASGQEIVRVRGAVVTHLYTRSDEDYEQLNRNYGLGIGAMCAKWVRSSSQGWLLLALVARRGISRYLRRIRSQRTRRGQGIYLVSVVRGIREARGIPIDGRNFVDLDVPAPVLLPATGTAPADPATGGTQS